MVGVGKSSRCTTRYKSTVAATRLPCRRATGAGISFDLLHHSVSAPKILLIAASSNADAHTSE